VIAAWILVTTRSVVNLSGRVRMHARVLKIKNGPLRLAEVKRGERPQLFARVVPSRSVLLEAAGVYAQVVAGVGFRTHRLALAA
jgi:hypothetical protein